MTSNPDNAAAVPPTKPQDRRARRQRVLKRATILNGVSNSETECVIRNMHEDGAELKVYEAASVPQKFLLYVPHDGVAYRCELRWRQGERCGVSFTGVEDKPHWHYG